MMSVTKSASGLSACTCCVLNAAQHVGNANQQSIAQHSTMQRSTARSTITTTQLSTHLAPNAACLACSLPSRLLRGAT